VTGPAADHRVSGFLQWKALPLYTEEEKQLSSVEIREVAGVSGYTNIISSGTPYTSIVM
jgi:hypothetical protein